MKISYYTCIPSMPDAEDKLWKVYAACQHSNLPFACAIEKCQGTYSIAVTIDEACNPFTSWPDMENYIRKFLIENNKAVHMSADTKRLEARLCQLQNQ